MSDSAPRLLGGRYEVGELIGRGGMAEVHLGYDARLGRTVAIKILRTDHARDTAFLTRFRREAQSVAGLNHRSIVAVYDSGEDRVQEVGGATLDIPYIVMEYVDGHTLREVLNDQGTLDPQEAARIVQQVLEALDYSHDMGIVHRDIKPGNVMVGDDGSVKVMDFGIARAIADSQATMTATQAVIGTAQYISPEQARGETVDKRSDVYSTGCLLFELLTGRTPYTGEPISLTYQHVNADIPVPSALNDRVPSEMDAIVVHSLTKDRDARYPDAQAMADDLAAFRSGMPISPAPRASLQETTETAVTPVAGAAGGAAAAEEVPTGPVPRRDPDTASMPPTGASTRRRRRMLGWLVALLVIVPLALLGWFVWDTTQGQEASTVTVPKVVGMSEEEATAELDELNLTTNSRTVSNNSPRGRVVSQDPPEGTSLQEGDRVTLTVSAGPDDVAVPSLVGMERDEAEKVLRDAGLKLGEVTTRDTAEQQEDRVVEASPAPMETVAKGTKVDLVIASGQVEIDDYRGQDIEDVRSTLYDLNLQVEVVEEGSSESEGTILGQDPGAGTVDQGSTVVLTVARAPNPTETVTTTPSPTSSSSSEPSSPTRSPTEDEPSPTSTEEPSETSTSEPSEPSETSTSSPPSESSRPSTPSPSGNDESPNRE